MSGSSGRHARRSGRRRPTRASPRSAGRAASSRRPSALAKFSAASICWLARNQLPCLLSRSGAVLQEDLDRLDRVLADQRRVEVAARHHRLAVLRRPVADRGVAADHADHVAELSGRCHATVKAQIAPLLVPPIARRAGSSSSCRSWRPPAASRRSGSARRCRSASRIPPRGCSDCPCRDRPDTCRLVGPA